MRILVLSNLYPPHHAGTHDLRCQTVTEALRTRGHEIRVLTSNHGVNTEQRDQEIERRLRLNDVFGHPSASTFAELRALELHNHQALGETLAEYQPDLVHVWSLHGLPKSFIFALRNSRLPTVYDIADLWLANELRADPWLSWWNRPSLPFPSGLRRTLLELTGGRNRFDKTAPTRMAKGFERLPELYRAVAANSISVFRLDRLYFCSRALKLTTQEAGFRVDHGDVIYPGIPTELYLGEVKPAVAPLKKFLIVARLAPESGIMTGLLALQKARENRLPATLSIYGRGESDFISQLRSYVVQRQLPVEFLTVSNVNKDLAAVYRQHDAFLYTSEWAEPFAPTVLEAMACGLPVIGATIGGAAELFRHGENALTFTAGEPDELAARMQELQTQPALRCQIAENGQSEVMSRYHQSATIDQIETYLETSRQLWQES